MGLTPPSNTGSARTSTTSPTATEPGASLLVPCLCLGCRILAQYQEVESGARTDRPMLIFNTTI